MEILVSDKDEIIQNLREDINTLRNEIVDREKLYLKQRKKTQEFEDEVYESEGKMVEKLNEKSDIGDEQFE